MRVLCARSNKRGLVETRTKRLQPHPCPRAPAHANSLPRARTPLHGHYLGSNMGASGAPAGFSGEMCAAMSFGAQPPTEGLAEYVKSELMPMTPAGPQKKTRRHHDGSARTAGQPSSQGGEPVAQSLLLVHGPRATQSLCRLPSHQTATLPEPVPGQRTQEGHGAHHCVGGPRGSVRPGT